MAKNSEYFLMGGVALVGAMLGNVITERLEGPEPVFTVEMVQDNCSDSGQYFPLSETLEAKVWVCRGYMVFIPDSKRPYVGRSK